MPYLIKRLIFHSSNVDDLILDFFAGSGTTADAVLQLNVEVGGKRKFILAQLPELIDPKSNKTAYDFVKNVIDLEPLNLKFRSFGFEVSEVNGHDIKELKKNFLKFKRKIQKKCSVTICHTVKGKGFKLAENNPYWHHKNSFTSEEIKFLLEDLR